MTKHNMGILLVFTTIPVILVYPVVFNASMFVYLSVLSERLVCMND